MATTNVVSKSLSSSAVSKCSFEVVYTKVLGFIIDLTDLPLFKSNPITKTAEDIQKMLQEVKQHLEFSYT